MHMDRAKSRKKKGDMENRNSAKNDKYKNYKE